MKKKLLLFLLVWIGVCFNANAGYTYPWDFQSGGINYKILSGSTVSVTYNYHYSSSGTYTDYDYNVCGYSGDVVIPSTVTYNGTTYTVTEIGYQAFYPDEDPSYVTSVTLPNTIQKIASDAFEYCDKITSIKIPSATTTINNYAFYGCSKLTDIYIETTTPPAITSSTFSNKNATLHVPGSAYAAYKSASYWSSFSNIVSNNPASSLNISDNSIILKTGATKVLSATVLPSTACNSVKWTSSDTNIATVSSDGTVTAKAGGRVTITATTVDGTNLSAKCDVLVRSDNSIYAEDVKVRPTETSLELPLYLNNTVTMCGFEFYLSLPKGVSLAYDYDDEEEEYVWGVEKGGRLREEHSINVSKNADGKYHFLCADLLSNKNFYDSEAKKNLPLVILKLRLDGTTNMGENTITISDILLNHNENSTITEYKLAKTTSLLSLLNLYAVNVTSNNDNYGTVSLAAQTYDATYGDAVANDVVTLTATPNEYYRFVKWTENGNTVSTSNPYSFTLNSDRNIVGVFELHQVTVTFKVDGVTYSSGLQTCGTALTLPTEPSKTGYTFKGWDGVTNTTVVPTSNVTYNAVFEINQYTVTFLDYDNTIISQKKQNWNSIITAPANPSRAGYFFYGWNPSVDSRVPLYDVSYKAEYVMAGDVTLDGKRNLTDLTTLVNMIMNNVTPEGRAFLASDVNKDNKLNLTDMTSIVNLILGGNTSQAKPMMTSEKDELASIDLTTENLMSGKVGMLSVKLNDSEDRIANIQFDLSLPYGFELVSENAIYATTRGVSNGHNIAINRLENGDVRVMLYSFDNSNFSIGDGNIVNIMVNVDDFIMDGTYDVDLKNVVLVRNDASSIEYETCTFAINVGSAMGIGNINNDSSNDNIYNIGGQKLNNVHRGINIINGKKTIINKK